MESSSVGGYARFRTESYYRRLCPEILPWKRYEAQFNGDGSSFRRVFTGVFSTGASVATQYWLAQTECVVLGGSVAGIAAARAGDYF